MHRQHNTNNNFLTIARAIGILIITAMISSLGCILPLANIQKITTATCVYSEGTADKINTVETETTLQPPLQPVKPLGLANHVVISEVFYDSASGDANCFIELYNPKSEPVDISGWDIVEYENNPPAEPAIDTNWPITITSGVIQPGGFWLLGEEATIGPDEWGYTINADTVLTAGTNILENGPDDGWMLRDAADNYVDMVMIWASEGTTTMIDEPALSDLAAGNSWERKSGAVHDETGGNGWDTDDNVNDFIQRTVPEPQNSASPPELAVDTSPPYILNAYALDLTHVDVVFNEPVNETDVEALTNWSIYETLTPSNTIPVTAAVLDADTITVHLTTGAQTEGMDYTVNVTNIKDRAEPPNLQPFSTGTFIGGGFFHVVINEVMYNPSTLPETRYEWIEIYNPRTTDIDISGWTITDFEGTWTFPADSTLPGKGHIIIAQDGTHFFLNNNFYPDYEKTGSTDARDLTLSGSLALANAGDELVLNNSAGEVYDAVVWASGTYGTITPYTGSVDNDQSIGRTDEGWEGAETESGASPTGHDETTEDIASAFTTFYTPTPETGDLNPPIISNVQYTWGSVVALINWTTYETGYPEINPHSTTEVVYAPDTDPDSTTNITVSIQEYVTFHEIMLTDLMPNTTYYFYVKSTDGLGHTAIDKNGGLYYNFTTKPPDYNPPVLLSGPIASATDTTAIIRWTTDENSTSVVFYGDTLELLDGNSNLILSTYHEVTLYDLKPSTTYYYEICSRDPSGNELVANNSGTYYTFTTLAPSPQNIYWANLHSHTGYSDGAAGSTPADAYAYARDTAGIDILAVTDHSEQLNAGEYANMLTAANDYTQDGVFVAIAGQEWGNLYDHGHSNVWGATEVCPIATTDLTGFYDWVANTQSVRAGFNHPGYGTNFDAFNYTAVGERAEVAMEILNGKRPWDYEDHYVQALSKGWHIGAIGGQDNHDWDWGTKDSYGFYYYTGVIAPSLTKPNVFTALETFRTYCLRVNDTSPENIEDKIELWFSVNGHFMGSEFNESHDLKFNITVYAPYNNFEKIELYEDGRKIRWESNIGTNAFSWYPTIELTKGHHFYFVKVYQQYSVAPYDEDIAWSSPIWVNCPVFILPDDPPSISNVAHEPTSPTHLDDVKVTATVTDDYGIRLVKIRYSLNGSSVYNAIKMYDDGTTSGDEVANDGIYTGKIPALPNGTAVKYYIEALDTSALRTTKPSTAPTYFYSYFVGPHVVIQEVYANGLGTADHGEFVELYNPTGDAVDISGWSIQDEYNDWYEDKWAFPSGTVLPADGLIVVACDAGSPTEGFTYEFGFEPDFEYVYGTDTDDATVPNMVPVSVDSELVLNNAEDALHLRNEIDVIIDQVEFGGHGVKVPGEPIDDAPEQSSISRDAFGSDTDNCSYDFWIITPPSPGVATNVPPKIWDVTQSPPVFAVPVTITAKIKDETTTFTATLSYSVNGGTWSDVTMVDDGSAYGDIAGDGIYTAQIPGQPNGTKVEYYISATDDVPQTGYSPPGWPTAGNYSYYVGLHVVISEVYVNPPTTYDGAEYIELFNPTDVDIDISDWVLDENHKYDHEWAFPASTIIPAHGFLVIARDGSDTVDNDGFYEEFGFYPDFELYDANTVNSGFTDIDTAEVPNMVLLTPSPWTDELRISNYDITLYLYDNTGFLIDAVEYGWDNEYILGAPANTPGENQSLARDLRSDRIDTDDASSDFKTIDYVSPGKGQVMLTLSPGWNMISLPFVQADTTVSKVFEPIAGSYWVVWYYNASDTVDHWKRYMPTSIFNDLTDVDHTMSLWVYMNVSDTLIIMGDVPLSTTIQLYAGWNFVSFPRLTAQYTGDAIASIITYVITVWHYEPPPAYPNWASFNPDYPSPFISPLQTMEPALGYWINMEADTLWTITA